MDTLIEKPIGFLHNLYYMAVQESKNDAKKVKERQEQDTLEEMFEDSGVPPGGMRGGVRNGPRGVPRKPVQRKRAR